VRPPGNARDDWEILRDLLQALGGSNGLYSIDDLFRQMSAEIPEFGGLTLNKIGDLGVEVTSADESPLPPVDPKEHDIEEAEKKRPPDR
jgi:NADH-quinone oxidoreductase subunit G